VERNTKRINSVAISPDGRFIAASDLTGTVWLWDGEKLELLSQTESSVEGLASLSFSSEGETLKLAHIDGSVSCWKLENGKLLAASATSSAIILRTEEISSLDRKRGWKRGGEAEEREVILRRLPSDDLDAGTWAYIDGKVIRTSGADSLTIFDVGGEESLSA
jgi:WD40 repeat protein